MYNITICFIENLSASTELKHWERNMREKIINKRTELIDGFIVFTLKNDEMIFCLDNSLVWNRKRFADAFLKAIPENDYIFRYKKLLLFGQFAAHRLAEYEQCILSIISYIQTFRRTK